MSKIIAKPMDYRVQIGLKKIEFSQKIIRLLK